MKPVATSLHRTGRASRRLGSKSLWLLVLASACSVYDESLLAKRSSVVTTGGAPNDGEGGEGAELSGGSSGNGSGGSARGGGAGTSGSGGLGSGGELTGGANSGGASGSTNGGAPTGGVAAGGMDAGAGGEAGEISTGGTGGTSGGTTSGGTTSGGVSSGGAASGGASKGGATSGGASSGGTTSGGAAGKGGSGGSSGSCGGKLSGGICWYVGAVNQSCEAVCSSHGSVNGAMAGVVGTATQGGSKAKCQTLANLFGATRNVLDGSRDDGLGLGCHFYDPDIYWLMSPDFTEDAAEEGARIICGCNR